MVTDRWIIGAFIPMTAQYAASKLFPRCDTTQG